jgi:SAM-dependent methyltransferase
VTDDGFDHSRARVRSRIEAMLLDVAAPAVHEAHGKRKGAVIGAMSGTVVELGPGTGANLRYYAGDVQVIGLEPNPAMHDRLRAAAREYGVDLEIRAVKGERMPVADASADGVVCTLVLCGVDDPARVLGEVRRILKPGATFFFLEHVAAPEGTTDRTVQSVVRRPHRWMFNGCDVMRDTERLIREAGFAHVDAATWVGPASKNLYVRHQIIGTATV